MWNWLKHAFAVEPADKKVEATTEQRAIVDRVCTEVVRRHMTTPALMFLEMSRPLNFLGSQVIHFFSPMIAAVTGKEGQDHFARFLEQRGSIDYICQRLEDLEAEATRRETPTKTGNDPESSSPKVIDSSS